MASSGRVVGIDGWKNLAGTLSQASEKFKTVGLRAGYHNHQAEFQLLEGQRPIEVLAANTPREFMLQFDVGTCVEVGYDPIAWIRANPGRINSVHCPERPPAKKATACSSARAFAPGPKSSTPPRAWVAWNTI
jgi:sugar phosphate isomerase/epimerase